MRHCYKKSRRRKHCARFFVTRSVLSESICSVSEVSPDDIKYDCAAIDSREPNGKPDRNKADEFPKFRSSATCDLVSLRRASRTSWCTSFPVVNCHWAHDVLGAVIGPWRTGSGGKGWESTDTSNSVNHRCGGNIVQCGGGSTGDAW